MKRTELIDHLSKAAPALARTGFIPVLQSFCFTGKQVLAYNDTIGLQVDLDTDFTGAITGDVLLGLLRASSAVEADLAPLDNGNLQLTLGSAKIKVGVEPVSQFTEFWEGIKPNPAKQIALGARTPTFVQMLEAVMLSVSGDTTIPDQMGVTFIPADGGVLLFAQNGSSVSRAYCKLKKAWPTRVIIPTIACLQICAIAKATQSDEGSLTLEVFADHLVAAIGGTMIYSRVIESERPSPFEETYDALVTDAMIKRAIPIPRMHQPLERAAIIMDSKIDAGSGNTIVKIVDGLMTLISETQSRGRCVDKIKVPGHPDIVRAEVNAKALKGVIDTYFTIDKDTNGTMIIGKRALMLAKEEMTFLLSCEPGKAKAD